MTRWYKLALGLTFLALVLNLFNDKSVYVRLDSTSDILKTVAHVDLSYREDLKQVYVDVENDVAYYIYLNKTRNLSLGDTVYLMDGSECTVTYIDAFGFAFKSDSTLTQGLSGTAIRNANGVQLGYISKRLNTDEIYCIWS